MTKPDAERKATQRDTGQKAEGQAKGAAKSPQDPTQESPVAEGGSRPRESQAGVEVASKEPHYPDSGKNPYDKGAVEALKDALDPFSRFMASIAPVGGFTEEVEQPQDGRLTLTSTSRITPTLEVVVEIVSSVEAGPAEPTRVSATVSNPLTGQVLSKTSPTVVHEPDEVSNAAIGEAVEAVVTASAGESMATSQELGGEFPDGLLSG